MNAATRGGSGRGRGRGGRGGAQSKVEVPDADFDFQTANAKFNKQELAKEAVSSSPLGETPNGDASETPEPEDGAYNKTKSFFDNISSEARERAENGGQKPGGREWRGEEQRKIWRHSDKVVLMVVIVVATVAGVVAEDAATVAVVALAVGVALLSPTLCSNPQLAPIFPELRRGW